MLDEKFVASRRLVGTRAYFQSSLTWCVQKKKQIPVYQLLFHICTDPIVYVVAILSSSITLCLAYFMQQFERRLKLDYFDTILNGLCVFVGFACPYKPENNAHRLAFVFVIFGGIIFVSTSTTLVVKLFTSPIYHPQIETIKEILNNNFNLAGSQFALYQLEKQNEVNVSIVWQCLKSKDNHANMFQFRLIPPNR